MRKLKLILAVMGLFISTLLIMAIAGITFLLTMPDVTQLEKCFTTSMFKVNLCATSKNYVPLKSISPYVLHAVIAAEDGSFYSHRGFDWHEIRASLTTNLRAGKVRRGGSTLTQQLAKNAFLNQEKSYLRKIKEAYLAYAIESKYSKDFILEKYLNVVEFGPNIFGVKQAAAHYFQKSPSALHPLEAAFLAFLLPNPKIYSRGFAQSELTPFGRKMINVILKRMSAFGKISGSALSLAHEHLDTFPWYHLSIESFEDAPSYSLDGPDIEIDYSETDMEWDASEPSEPDIDAETDGRDTTQPESEPAMDSRSENSTEPEPLTNQPADLED